LPRKPSSKSPFPISNLNGRLSYPVAVIRGRRIPIIFASGYGGLDCRVCPSWFSRPDLKDQPLRYHPDHELMPRGDPSR
jgi:hypothetical protein